MKKYVYCAVVIMASCVVFASFFMTWVTAATTATRIAKEVEGAVGVPGFLSKKIDKMASKVGELGDVKATITLRGVDIPQIFKRHDAKLAMSVGKLFSLGTEDYRKRSYLVYLVPLSAIICVVVAILAMKNRAWALILLLIGGAAGFGGFYKISTVDLASLPADVTIGRGIWTMLYSYIVIFFASLPWVIFKEKGQ